MGMLTARGKVLLVLFEFCHGISTSGDRPFLVFLGLALWSQLSQVGGWTFLVCPVCQGMNYLNGACGLILGQPCFGLSTARDRHNFWPQKQTFCSLTQFFRSHGRLTIFYSCFLGHRAWANSRWREGTRCHMDSRVKCR